MGHKAKFELRAGGKLVDISGAQIEMLAYAEASAPCSVTLTDLWGCNNDQWNQPPGLGTLNGQRVPGPGKHMVGNLPTNRGAVTLEILVDRRKDPKKPSAGMYAPFEVRNTVAMAVALRLQVEKDRYVYGGCGWYLPMLTTCSNLQNQCGEFFEIQNSKELWDAYEQLNPPPERQLLAANSSDFWGCGDPCTPFEDEDLDALPDCYDQCPLDPDKIVGGLCGCGVSDLDSDRDDVPDCQDPCPLLRDCQHPCMLGDADIDGDVDLDDFGAFQRCYSPGAAATQSCRFFDFNLDDRIDGNDFSYLERCRSRANVPALPGC